MSDGDPDDGVLTTRRLLDRDMVHGKYSDGLVGEIDSHVEKSTANVFRIMAEIGVMEGAQGARPQGTKPAEPFRGPWLHGLWYKHYIQACKSARTRDPERLSAFNILLC